MAERGGQGTTTISLPFKDGTLCVGAPTQRLQMVSLDGSGSASSTISIVTKGSVSAGQTRTYQFWFRDGGPGSVCGFDSNLTHAIEVPWE